MPEYRSRLFGSSFIIEPRYRNTIAGQTLNVDQFRELHADSRPGSNQNPEGSLGCVSHWLGLWHPRSAHHFQSQSEKSHAQDSIASAKLPKRDADDVCHHALQRSNPRHLEATRPPGPNGNEGLCRTYGEMSQ